VFGVVKISHGKRIFTFCMGRFLSPKRPKLRFMLGKLIPAAWPLSGRAHDALFQPMPGGVGAPAPLLAAIYRFHADALPDEPDPPAHRRFRAMIEGLLGLGAPGLDRIGGLELKRARAAYVCCFERAERFQLELAQWRYEPQFRQELVEAREGLIEELIPYAAVERERRARLSRYWECMQTPIDLHGDTLLDLIRQMAPDDWHEMVLRWNWEHGAAPLDWITSQPDCDRATAIVALCRGNPGYVATHRGARGGAAGFVLALASRLENGFYMKADLSLDLPLRTRAMFARELAQARATRVSPWQLPDDLLLHPGRRQARPRYTLNDGQVHYHYDHWLAQLAAPPRARARSLIGLLISR
jgi:Domain of unknown function (DUF4274)